MPLLPLSSLTTPNRPTLAITMGDPAGIGPEIIIKALASPIVWRLCHPIVVGSASVMRKAIRDLRSPVKVLVLKDSAIVDPRSKFTRGSLPMLDPIGKTMGHFQIGKPSAGPGLGSVECVKKAVWLAMSGHVAGIVTAPINKKAINLAGYAYPGHTELLADFTNSKHVGMMILGGPLKVLFATTHVAIHDLSTTLTPSRILNAIRLANLAMQKYFKISKPHIGVAALNPHAGENGLFGNEECLVISPAIQKAKKCSIRVSGPLPADTLFGATVNGAYDVIVAMYHDQGLIPLKTIAFGRCVNMTVGLPIIRTSVDHGTAYDIVGQGKADPQSLIEAIKLAAHFARQT